MYTKIAVIAVTRTRSLTYLVKSKKKNRIEDRDLESQLTGVTGVTGPIGIVVMLLRKKSPMYE